MDDEKQVRPLIHQLVIGRSRDPRVQLIRSVFTSNISFILDFLLLQLFVNLIFRSITPDSLPPQWMGGLADFVLRTFGRELSAYSLIVVISSLVSYLTGTLVLYILSIKWVFSDRSVKNPHHERLIFFILAGIGLGLNSLMIWALAARTGLPVGVSKVISGVTIFFFNFTARKLLLFRNKR